MWWMTLRTESSAVDTCVGYYFSMWIGVTVRQSVYLSHFVAPRAAMCRPTPPPTPFCPPSAALISVGSPGLRFQRCQRRGGDYSCRGKNVMVCHLPREMIHLTLQPRQKSGATLSSGTSRNVLQRGLDIDSWLSCLVLVVVVVEHFVYLLSIFVSFIVDIALAMRTLLW